MTVGSLFAGIGGFDLAATRCGMDVRWQVEIDPWARRVLTKHWPDVPKFGDIRELRGDELEPVDLICGGFPCQPFSNAGKRMGAADDRYLWPEMLRLAEKLQPRWVVGENVPGLLRMGLDEVCAGLEGGGYEVWTLGIPACAVGAPHRRERLWLVAYARHTQPPRRNETAGRGQGTTQCFTTSRCGALAHANGILSRYGHDGTPENGRLCASADAGRRTAIPDAGFWDVEPPVGRVAHGIPGRVDRLRGLGNAIVPAVAEQLFRWILEAERANA